MSATILPFITREQYNAKQMEPVHDDGSPLSPSELHEKLCNMAFGELSSLISKFRATGKWNPDAETHMRNAIDEVVKVCVAVSGDGKQKDNGKTGQTA